MTGNFGCCRNHFMHFHMIETLRDEGIVREIFFRLFGTGIGEALLCDNFVFYNVYVFGDSFCIT